MLIENFYTIELIYFIKKIKILIHFIISSTWIHIRKEKLLGRVFIINDVQNNVNLDKLLIFNLGYKKLRCMRTSLDYLDCFRKDIFAMIRQLKPLTFFATFTMGVNKWPTII